MRRTNYYYLYYSLFRIFLSQLQQTSEGSELSALLAEADPHRCKDAFDEQLKKQCMRGEWEQKYYFERDSRECQLFWYDGCPGLTGSRNFFDSLLECQWLCEPGQTQNAVCVEPFDEHLRDECDGAGNWRRRFYFDRIRRRCVPFWYDGCDSSSGNQFNDEHECARTCETTAASTAVLQLQRSHSQSGSTPQYIPAWRVISTTQQSATKKHKAIMQSGVMMKAQKKAEQRQPKQWPYKQPKIISIKKQQNQGTNSATEKPTTSKHRPSPSSSADTSSPTRTSALSPTSARPSSSSSSLLTSSRYESRPSSSSYSSATTTSYSSTGTKKMPKIKQEPSTAYESSSSSSTWMNTELSVESTTTSAGVGKDRPHICEGPNPCQNGGSCVGDVLTTQPICKCAPGFTNDFCSEKIDFDPCSPNPCQNGATCSASASPEKTDFDCFCARGFSGRHCELRPCDDNPCKNGGTCRTTRSQSLFFCACQPGWGGKTCMISVPPSAEAPDPMFEQANFTQQLSSGRAEWIEELNRVTPIMPNFGERTTADDDHVVRPANLIGLTTADQQVDGPSTFTHQRASSRRSKDQPVISGFPHEQNMIGQELPTRTLKGTTASLDNRENSGNQHAIFSLMLMLMFFITLL